MIRASYVQLSLFLEALFELPFVPSENRLEVVNSDPG